LPLSMAGRTGCADLEKTLRPYHLSSSLAGRAYFRLYTGGHPGPIANGAIVHPVKDDLFFRPGKGFFKGEFQVIPETGTLARM
jgi:hypothetical protein